jgi:hypothetical protein
MWRLQGGVKDYTINRSYCGASGAEGTTSDWISNVKLDTIHNASGKTTCSNCKDTSTVMYLNNSYSLETSINYAFDLDKVHAWIDYRRDGSGNTDERIAMSNLSLGADSTSAGNINVPPGIQLVETTLRVSVSYTNANPNPADPCHSYF